LKYLLLKQKSIKILRREIKMIRIGMSLIFSGLISLFIAGCSPTTQVTQSPNPTPDKASYTAKGNYEGNYWPSDNWRTCDPEAVGMDSQKLIEAIEYAAVPDFKSDGIVVVKNGYIVAEAYFGKFQQERAHISYSMAKSFTSALIGIAIDQGHIASIDEKVCQYYDAWDCADQDDFRSRITIRHALTLTTGLKWHEDWSKWDFATNDALKMAISGDFVKYMSERTGQHEPGTTTYYSTGDPMLLTQVIQKATGMNAFEFGKQNLFTHLNFSKMRWDSDGEGHTGTATGLFATTRDYAKFGLMFLNKGFWNGKQIVPEGWAEQSTQTDPSVKMSSTYGYLWHVNLPKKLKIEESSPAGIVLKGAYMAQGVLGQVIVIIPSKNLVIVRLANQRKVRMDIARLVNLVIEADK
jgi:CubicO group peptidase (beta-lactamase class C family)